jgi:broad specificity phosphatase PhoE
LRVIYSSDLVAPTTPLRELAAVIGTDIFVDPAWREIAVGSWTAPP